MAIRNRKGNTIAADGDTTKRNLGRPRKQRGPVIEPARCTEGGFHKVFPYHLCYKDTEGNNKNCYFQCEGHMNTHIERYKVDRRKSTIKSTEPRN